jgi:hypothetical protein
MPEWKNLLRYVASFGCEPILTLQTTLSHVTDAPRIRRPRSRPCYGHAIRRSLTRIG